MAGAANDELTGSLLKEVSRSFYLSLKVLPREIRSQISLAYLLARASDTVADTRAVPRAARLDQLRRLRAGDFGPAGALARDQALPAERRLLERLGECGARLAAFSPEDQGRIRAVLDTIIEGQIFDLERFPGEGDDRVTALSDEAELDRYTYMVAGCVGEFWTRMCHAHLPEFRSLDREEMIRLGIHLGKGLQLINILRDIPRDLRLGRCYLPVDEPEGLRDPAAFPRIRDEYFRWVDAAAEHLRLGEEYALRIPPSLWRVRLACVWPIWIGLGTLALLRRENPLDPERILMIPTSGVYLMLARTLLTCRSERRLRLELQRQREGLAQAAK
ncbi:MAG: hypothetical protein A2X36_16875 [Elusimicrobia bacterium GWA2_69_24]|nr:MAG: hypothetical protein A2X36_16875 [Elusimicrobia bacterium GWA2_69_24]HBL16105.1 farnesyl-diphosphate farnesyltransferase [Elusimicrobiota bacterium]